MKPVRHKLYNDLIATTSYYSDIPLRLEDRIRTRLLTRLHIVRQGLTPGLAQELRS